VAPERVQEARAAAPAAAEASIGPKWITVLKTFSTPSHLIFLFVVWWFGVGIGMVFSFLFWHLQVRQNEWQTYNVVMYRMLVAAHRCLDWRQL
jgi:hypothetical protein